MKQPAMTHDERCAGKKGDYLVYYRVGGKLYYQAIWAPNMVEAAERLVGVARELGQRAEVVRTLVRAPGREFAS